MLIDFYELKKKRKEKEIKANYLYTRKRNALAFALYLQIFNVNHDGK